MPFAGEGYYFWEENLEAARWWGKGHIQGPYRIFSIEITLRYDDGSFFDLIGNRRHLMLLRALIEKAKKSIGEECNTWKAIITLLTLEKGRLKLKTDLPFRIIRFNDYGMNPKRRLPILLGGE